MSTALRDILGRRAILHGPACLESALHRLGDLLLLEFHRSAVALHDGLDHAAILSSSFFLLRRFPAASCGFAWFMRSVSHDLRHVFHNM
ncbi:MAG: hypothetical protein ACLSGS_01720 [Adlercreutzia sp.]